MSDEDLAEYRNLWDGSEPGWVLVRSAEDPDSFLIYNERTRFGWLVEDDDKQKRVVERMLREKVPVLDQIPPGDFDPDTVL
jgi:hypothetical protein